MPRVPMDDPHLRSWKQLMAHVGLPETMPMPLRRQGAAGVGIGPVRPNEREVDPAPRPKPSPKTMRSEGGSPAQRIWPNLKAR
jgi:hypothetical protein